MTYEMLRLARAVYPGRVFVDSQYTQLPAWYESPDDEYVRVFDPANNSEQAWEVMAWLLRQDNCNEVNGAYVLFYLNAKALEEPLRIDHNGTPAGIRAAVVEAAVRVANA